MSASVPYFTPLTCVPQDISSLDVLAGVVYVTGAESPRLVRLDRPDWTRQTLVGGGGSLPRPLRDRPGSPLRVVRVYHRQRQPDGTPGPGVTDWGELVTGDGVSYR